MQANPQSTLQAENLSDLTVENPLELIQELRLHEMGVREQIVALVLEINRRRLYKSEKITSLRTYLMKELGYDFHEARQVAVAAGIILTGEAMTSSDHQVRARIEALRQWRTQKARIDRVPAYLILTNRVLMALANSNPLSLEAMSAVRGLGQGRITRFGNEILGVLRFTPQMSPETASVSRAQASSSSVSVVQSGGKR